jgi:hypothetical protein
MAGETVRLEGIRSDSGGIVSYRDAVFAPLAEDGRVVGFVDVTTDATERVSAYQILEQRVEACTREVERRRLVAERLRDILDALNSERTREEILAHIVRHASRLMESDACLIYRLDQDRQSMVMESEWGSPFDYRESRAGPIYPTAIIQAIVNGQPVGIVDLPVYRRKLRSRFKNTAFWEARSRSIGITQRSWFSSSPNVPCNTSESHPT